MNWIMKLLGFKKPPRYDGFGFTNDWSIHGKPDHILVVDQRFIGKFCNVVRWKAMVGGVVKPEIRIEINADKAGFDRDIKKMQLLLNEITLNGGDLRILH